MLTKKDIALQSVKKKNKGTGVPNALLNIGNVIMTIEAAVQLESVEKGIISGYTISAMYSQTTGPKDSPKLAIKITNPTIIKILPALLSLDLIRKPTATINNEITEVSVPNCNIIFLPNFAKMMLEIKLARNDSKLRMTGMTLAMDGNI